MAQHYCGIRTQGRVAQRLVGPVIEDNAVGEHFHHGAAVVQCRRRHNLFVESQLHIQAAGKEGTLCAKHQRTRIERMLHRAVRRGLGYGSELGCRRILPLGEAVDLIVEEDDVYVYVAAYCVDEVVPAYGERIAVSASLPYGEGRVGYLDSGADCRCPSVNAVETVGIHIIRKAGRAAYSGNNHMAFLLISQGLANLRKRSGESREHGVVSASRTPARKLVALEVLCCKYCHI